MKLIKLLFLVNVISLSFFKGFSQILVRGNIHSYNTPIQYGIVKIVGKEIFQYSDENGDFEIVTKSKNDTLHIQCNGYKDKKIILNSNNTNSVLNIELDPDELVLDEVIISIDKPSNSKWVKINPISKSKFYQAIPEGYNLITEFISQKDVKFNGIRFYVNTNPLNDTLLKKVRPILIINSSLLKDNILPNRVIILKNHKEKFTTIDIEFNHTISLLSNEKLSIGLELIPNDINNLNKSKIIGVVSAKKKKLKNLLTNLSVVSQSKSGKIENFIQEDICFDLKIVK